MTRALHWAGQVLLCAALLYLALVVEYDDNCTRYRAPWCDFLDASFNLVTL